MVIWSICHVVGHSKPTCHHPILYCRITWLSNSASTALMMHIVIGCDHHICVIVHLILLRSTAFVQTHFSKAPWYTIVVILSHVPHDLHMGPNCSVLGDLWIHALLRVTISLSVTAHLCIILLRRSNSIRNNSWYI